MFRGWKDRIDHAKKLRKNNQRGRRKTRVVDCITICMVPQYTGKAICWRVVEPRFELR